jgi:hypothetical protein
MKYLALLALLFATPALADDVAPPVAAYGAVFVFTICAKPVAFELIDGDTWNIVLPTSPKFGSLVATARKMEAESGNANFIELMAPGTCTKLQPLPTTDL